MRLIKPVAPSLPALIVALLLSACAHEKPIYRPILTEGFADSLERWNSHHPDRKIDQYDTNQILAIADNLLLMQRNNGGWPAHTNPFRPLSGDEKLRFLKDQNASDASFVDHNVFPQIYYLSHVYLQTGDVRYRNAARRALRLTISAQLYNGGWTERAVASTKLEVARARVDTQVTLDALIFLRKIASGSMPYGYISFETRREAADAVRKGDALLLRLQQAHNSRASIWASAYELETNLPAPASDEYLPSLNTPLSVAISRYLMRIKRPPAEVKRAVRGAHDWFINNTLQRWQTRYRAEFAEGDLRLPRSQSNLPAEPLWAERYVLETSEPQLACASMSATTQWLEHPQETGDWPLDLIEDDYPKWQSINNQAQVPTL
ncbi:pectate lyase [Gilvimarinus sp. DA14]|uniref:pectate lyase n=1 Tax=Gilvimarinus sp. DA14 TaxID=2956798 RepID=UPI0020B7A53E|nr:pectate lyase [Gilvimarinus sp. DA14]UTF59079.1 pectate lyase [Gilvimarinus sp. DA14]